jgi:hypothetical protein
MIVALSVDLVGFDEAGKELWCHMARFWKAYVILETYKDVMLPADPWPAWEGDLTVAQAAALQAEFGWPFPREWYVNDPDFEELLRPPTFRVRVIIQEWGYG